MKTLKLAAAITALASSMTVHAAGTIDLFTAPAGTTTVFQTDSGTIIYPAPVPAGPNVDGSYDTIPFLETDDSDALGSIIGGYRDMLVEVISTTTTAATYASSSMTVDNGTLSFNNDTGVTGRGTLQWDGQDNSSDLDTAVGLGGIDFLSLGDSFAFDVLSADAGFDFSIGLYDGQGNSVVFDLAANEGAHPASIAFSFFSNAHSTGLCNAGSGFTTPDGDVINSIVCGGTIGEFDITDINAMEVVFNTNDGVVDIDLSITSITAVPEPSSLALIGLGLMATGFASKRKSKKA